MMRGKDKFWKTIHSEYIYSCPWVKLRKDVVRLPSGKTIDDFYVTESEDWVIIIAVTPDDKIVMENQYRHGIQQTCLELPAGKVEPGETPLEAAKRELLEETGYSSNDWKEFMISAPNPSGVSVKCTCFIAVGAVPTTSVLLDEHEDIDLLLMTKEEVKEQLADNFIIESVMQAALWKYFNNTGI